MTIPCRSRWRSVRNTFLCPATDVCKPRLSVHSPARRTMRTMSSERPFHHLVRTGPLAVSPRHYLQSDDHSPPASNDEFSNSWESISSCSQKREFRFRLVFAVFLQCLGLVLKKLEKVRISPGRITAAEPRSAAPGCVSTPPRCSTMVLCCGGCVVRGCEGAGTAREPGRRGPQGGAGANAARERGTQGNASRLRRFALPWADWFCPFRGGRACGG